MNNQQPNILGNLIGGITIPPITVKVDKESLMNIGLMAVFSGSLLIVIYFVLASQLKK